MYMPSVSYALTHRVKRQWEAYWALRPHDEPTDLLDVLDGCQPATDFAAYDFEPVGGAELWEHEDVPDHAFIVKDNGVEWVVTGMTLKQMRRATELLKRKPKSSPVLQPPVPPVFSPPPEIKPLPEGLDPEQMVEAAFERLTAVDSWLSTYGHRHPQRSAVTLLKSKCLAEYNRAKLDRAIHRSERFALQSQRDASDDVSESDTLVTNERGRLLLAPCVRWLLREVKELRRTVGRLEGRAWESQAERPAVVEFGGEG